MVTANVFELLNRQTNRATPNPADKATVVSIFPKDVHEIKPTIEPGEFFIPKGSLEKPSLLVVGSSSWWRDLGPEEPLLEIPISSIQIADSIVRDYANGLLECDMSTKMPGLFYIPGEVTVTELLKEAKYRALLQKADEKQKAWFHRLIELADYMWVGTSGNPRSIPGDARLAAEQLGLANTKEWMRNVQAASLVRCFACGSMRNPQFPICPTCKVIDPSHPLAKEIKFAV